MMRRNIALEVKLIDDLLDMSRVATGKLRLEMKRVSVHEVLRHAVRSSMVDTGGKRLHIQQELNAVADCMQADSARLQQVFWNLLRNAVKFTSAEGTVTIRTWNPPASAASPGSCEMIIEVQDTGIGIPADALPKIFDAFEQGDARVTRQFGGLGLGLAIAKTVTEMHGGKISAASDGKGKGATFRIQFTVEGVSPPSPDNAVRTSVQELSQA
jgi:signal transduction histidine kinase